MWSKFKEFLSGSNEPGLKLPTAYDSSTGQPSTTLLFFYIGCFVSVLSLIAYHMFVDKLLGPTSMSLLFFGMTFVFYRLRNLDHVKFDLDDKSIELDDNPDMPAEKKEEK